MSNGGGTGFWSKLKGLAGSRQRAPAGQAGCNPPPNHTVKVELRYKDTRDFVPAADCQILQAATVINSGPLAAGVLESTGLPGGTYSVTFPDIDASEWEEG